MRLGLLLSDTAVSQRNAFEGAESVSEESASCRMTLLYHEDKAAVELSQSMRLGLLLNDTAVSQSKCLEGAESVLPCEASEEP